MNTDRAIEIIAAYGADARRWPDAERAPALALAANDASAGAALADAAALDPLLAEWARADAGTLVFDAGDVTRKADSGRWRWFAGGGLAAAAAAVVAVMMPVAPARQPVAPPQAAAVTVKPATATSSDAAFAYVFTPTYDEEQVI